MTKGALELRVGNGEGLEGIAHRPVVDRAIEIGGHGEYSPAQLPGNFLVDLVRGGIEFAHRIAVYHIDKGILPCADGEMARVPAGVLGIHQQDSAA